MLHSLYIYYPSKEASQEKLNLSEENMAFMTKAFKFAVRLQKTVNFLIVIPISFMQIVMAVLSSYQDHKTIGKDFFFEIFISLPTLSFHSFYSSQFD